MGRWRRTIEPRRSPRVGCSRSPGTTSSTISDGERHEGDARGPDYEIQREGRDRSGPARGDWRIDEDGPDRIEGRDEVSFLVEGPARGGAPRRRRGPRGHHDRSEEHTSELQSLTNLVCRLLLEKKKNTQHNIAY